jgi:hypothetical protein
MSIARRLVCEFAGVRAGGDPLAQAPGVPLKQFAHEVQWIAIGTEFGSRRRL